MDHPYGKQYGQEGNPRAYMTMRDYRNLPYQWGNQQPVGRNPNPPRSMREYRDQWMSAPVYSVPSTYPPPPQYDHPEPPFYASIPQSPQSPQPPQLISPLEQAILNLTKQVDNFVEESSLDKELDGFQNDFDQKLGILREAISKLTNQLVHQEEENLEEESQEEECLTETVLVEQVQLQPQEELKVESLEAPEELQDTSESGDTFWPRKQEEQTSALISEEESQEEECQNGTMVEEPCLQQPQQGLVENSESLEIGVIVCLWEKEDAIPLLLTEEAVEENKENIFPLPPTDSVYILPLPASQSQHKTNAIAQDTKYPLPAVPPDSVFILPIPAPQPTPVENPKPATPAPKSKSNPPLHAMQNIKRLVASVHAFATTSKTMATAYIAWHSGWFGCGFGFGAPEPRHF